MTDDNKSIKTNNNLPLKLEDLQSLRDELSSFIDSPTESSQAIVDAGKLRFQLTHLQSASKIESAKSKAVDKLINQIDENKLNPAQIIKAIEVLSSANSATVMGTYNINQNNRSINIQTNIQTKTSTTDDSMKYSDPTFNSIKVTDKDAVREALSIIQSDKK